MPSAIDRAAELLFGEEGRATLNVRFLCGGDSNVSAERLAEQIVLALTQVRAGRARLVENVDEHLTALCA